MTAIHESIDVAASVESVRMAWPRFLQWILLGPARLACDQLCCVHVHHTSVIRFISRDATSSTVELALPGADRSPAGEAVLAERMRHDLRLFKAYVEHERLPAAERRRIERHRQGRERPGTNVVPSPPERPDDRPIVWR